MMNAVRFFHEKDKNLFGNKFLKPWEKKKKN